MAKSPEKKVRKRAEQTVRERSEQTKNAKPKRRLATNTAKRVFAPFKTVAKLIIKIARPFRFLLWPFKTRPMRFIGRTLAKLFLINYFQSAWKELKKVTWPGRRETWQLTVSVFMFAIVFGVVISIVDYGLDKIFKQVILK